MKFRQKIFLISFVFVTISIYLIGIIIINDNYRKLIDSKMESSKASLYHMENILRFYSIEDIDSNLFYQENTYYEIAKDGNILFTNLFMDKNTIAEILPPSDTEMKAMMVDKMLYMTAQEEDFEIVIAEDVTDIFENRQEQIQFFIQVGIVFSFLIAFCLYCSLFLLTKKMSTLEKAVKKIQKGHYATRVKNLGKDEIGRLGESFNQMANAVEENIVAIQKEAENRKQFIHNLTHEIRTPLTTIIGYSSLIKSGKIQTQEKIQAYNQRIYEEGNYLHLLSQRLMDMVLLDNQPIELTPIHISYCVKKAVENIQEHFPQVTFIQNIEENIILSGDAVLLYTLVCNLLKNGAVACENQAMRVVETCLHGTVLQIKDTGKGMSKEQLEKVVEPFYTLSQDRNRKLSGMGLGLPLCIKICNVLGATIHFESKLGEGTVVTVLFTS